MKKVFYLAFCLVLVAGVGCAITDYSIITDNDQVITNQSANATVNTNGKAHIRSFQIALIFGNGADEIINFVDQKTNGDRTLTSYNNFSTFAGPGPTFHDDLYCNPDWQGCAGWTAHDPPGGFDRAGVGGAAFDGSRNPNCNGSRSIVLFAATLRQSRGVYNDGECGRAPGLEEVIQVYNMGQIGHYAGTKGLWYYLDSSNTNMAINGVQMPVVQTPVFLSPGARLGAFLMTNPLHAISMNAAGAVIGQGDIFDLTLIHNGIAFERQMKLGVDPATHSSRLY